MLIKRHHCTTNRYCIYSPYSKQLFSVQRVLLFLFWWNSPNVYTLVWEHTNKWQNICTFQISSRYNYTTRSIFANQGLRSAFLLSTLGRLMTKSTVFFTCRHCLHFAIQWLLSAPLLFTFGRLSRNFWSPWYCLLFDAAAGGCVQSKCA
jgi:hypothetical protein